MNADAMSAPHTHVATPAAPLARRGVGASRRWLRRVQQARTVAVAASLLACAALWLFVLDVDDPDGALLYAVPAIIGGSAFALFVRAPWAAVVVRAALWGTFVCGALVGFAAHDADQRMGLLLAAAAVGGILALGRFSRSLGGARPLLVATIACGVSDAVTHGLVSLFLLVMGSGTHIERVILIFGFASMANVVGLVCLLRKKTVVPHVIGNAIVVVLAVTNALDADRALDVAMGGAALLQIVCAVLLRVPPASIRVRRLGERALRVALVAALLALTLHVLG